MREDLEQIPFFFLYKLILFLILIFLQKKITNYLYLE